jgi:hypothetical protein
MVATNSPVIGSNSNPIAYSDIGEVKALTRVREVNALLSSGEWVLLTVQAVTSLGAMNEDMPAAEGNQKTGKPQESQRYVKRTVGYVVGRVRGSDG